MHYSKNSLTLNIKHTKEKIGKKYEEIENLKKELEKQEQTLLALQIYENSPIEERTLKVYLDKQTATVSLMDKFESYNENGFKRYARIQLYNDIYVGGHWGHYIIERLEGQDFDGSITMTNFKMQYTSELTQRADNEVRKVLQKNKYKSGMEIIFSRPYKLRAQNSSNLRGYGNIYNGENLVYSGTLYGETTSYAIVGVILD